MDEQVIILRVDDWTALYADGEVVYQGHDLPFWMLKTSLSGDTPLRNIDESPHDYNPWVENWAHEYGRLPDTYEEVEEIVNAPRD